MKGGRNKDSKALKHFKLSRKEARARIGLGSIPDDKIEEFMKDSKPKVKPQELSSTNKSNNTPVPTFQYQGANRSRQSQEQKIKNNKSVENNRVRVRETLKIRFPETRIVNERAIESSKYDNDLASSINDFDEFTPMYHNSHKNKNKKSGSKPKNFKISKEKESFRGLTQDILTEEEKQKNIEGKRELVKQQRKAKLKKIKEEKELERKQELKRKQNLENLNNMLK